MGSVEAAPLFGAQTLRDARSRGDLVIAGSEIDALTRRVCDLADAPSILQRFRDALKSIGFAGQR